MFSWSQARFYLSGWYGVGSALERLLMEHPEQFALLSPHLYTWAPLHYALSNAATCLAAADPDVMNEYAALVEDATLRDRLLADITEELERTVAHAGTDLRRDARRTSSEHRRAACACGASRSGRCIANRSRCCATGAACASDGDDDGAAALLPGLLLTVNAIASGLGATG